MASGEELARFVSVRAPEKKPRRRQIVLKLNTSFAESLTSGSEDDRHDASAAYTESDQFIKRPEETDIGERLLFILPKIKKTSGSNDEAVRLLVKVLRSLFEASGVDDRAFFFHQGPSTPPSPRPPKHDLKELKSTLAKIVASEKWKTFAASLSDSGLALGFFQPKVVNSSQIYEDLYRLVWLTESLTDCDKFAQVDVSAVLSSVPRFSHLEEEGERLDANDKFDEDSSDNEDPDGDMTQKARALNLAADFFLNVPVANLSVEVEESIDDEAEGGGDVAAEQQADEDSKVTGTRRVLAKYDRNLFDVADQRVQSLVDGKIQGNPNFLRNGITALGTLNSEERSIFSGNAFTLRGLQSGGTKLVSALRFNSLSRAFAQTMDPTLNLGQGLRRAVLGQVLRKPLSGIIRRRFGSIGVGELLVIRQNLKEYRSSDISHIENILNGEMKSREHRRLRKTEEELFTETERKAEEERDTQTTEKFELASEVKEEINKKFTFEAGLKISAKLGPVVELEADTRFGFEGSKTESRQKTTSFSRETTEKAATRFSERVVERRVRKFVEEVEEKNIHGFAKSDKNVSGVYQWVSKVYEAQVFNYGLRQMYEVFVPEPSLFYIGSLAAKATTDGEGPAPPPAFNVEPSWINRNNYEVYAARYEASDVPPPPEDFTKVDVTGGGESSSGEVAASFSAKIPEGYEYFRYSWSWSLTKKKKYHFNLKVSEVYGDPGVVPVFVQGRGIVSWAFWVHVVCRLNPEAKARWRLRVWETLRAGYEKMQREYEEQIAAAAVSTDVEIAGRNPLANQRIIRDEIQRQSLSAILNTIPGGGAGLTGGPQNTSINWIKAYQKGLFVRFFSQAFEWENVTYSFYPYFWARRNRWLDLFNIEDIDPQFQSFLQSGMARVVVPVRPGFEGHVEYFRRNGRVWSGRTPPQIGDGDFISIVEELKAQTGAPGDEEPIGDPWEIVLPTALVKLREDDKLPRWEKDSDGKWVEIEQQG